MSKSIVERLIAIQEKAAAHVHEGRKEPKIRIGRTRPPQRGAGEGTPVGAWGGKEYYWPKVKRFEFYVEKADAFGDAYEVYYQYDPPGDLTDLIVTFYADNFIKSEGKRAGQWEARSHSQTKKGTFRDLTDVPKVLLTLIKWAEKNKTTINNELKRLSDKNWNVEYDGYELIAEYRGNRSKYSEAHMTVTFHDVEGALFLGETGQAEVHFVEGADPDGPYGVKTDRKPFKSVEDIKRVLKQAEMLWSKWYQDLQTEARREFRRLLETA